MFSLSLCRAAEIIYTLAKAESIPLADGLDTSLTKARRNLGLFQHHDGITGTAKNHVVVDYGGRYYSLYRNVCLVFYVSVSTVSVIHDHTFMYLIHCCHGYRLLEGVNGADRVMAASAQALLLGRSQTQSTAGEIIFDVSETRAQHDALPEKTVIQLADNEKR